MISYLQFLLLSYPEKKQYLAYKGIFLLNYLENGKQIKVFKVSDFFVEIHTDEDGREDAEIISFKSLTRLEQLITLGELSI